MKKDKRTNNDLQNTTQKTNDGATQTQLKTTQWPKDQSKQDKQRSIKHYTEN